MSDIDKKDLEINNQNEDPKENIVEQKIEEKEQENISKEATGNMEAQSETKQKKPLDWKKMIKTMAKILCALLVIVVLLCCFLIPYSLISSRRTVSSNVAISLEKVTEIASLQVLSVSDSEVIVENAEDNKDGITVWVQYTGRGDFVVNLRQIEVIADNVRKTVIIKTPRATIDQDSFTLEYKDTEILFFHNRGGNDGYRDGVRIADSQYQEAYGKLYDKITKNPYYYRIAEESAEKIITSLVKSSNPDIPDLQVIVEIGAI